MEAKEPEPRQWTLMAVTKAAIEDESPYEEEKKKKKGKSHDGKLQSPRRKKKKETSPRKNLECGPTERHHAEK